MTKTLLLAGVAALGAFLAFQPSSRAATITNSCAQGFTTGGGLTNGCVIPPVTSAAAETSHIMRSGGPATVVDFQVNNTSASAIWVLLLDANAVPSPGTLTGCATAATTRPCVAKWYQVPANQTMGVTWSPGPFLQLQTGVVMLCSSAGPLTYTATSSCVFSYEGM